MDMKSGEITYNSWPGDLALLGVPAHDKGRSFICCFLLIHVNGGGIKR